jgi:hypothetical protein
VRFSGAWDDRAAPVSDGAGIRRAWLSAAVYSTDLDPARALAKAGLPAEVQVHNLRHSGNTLTGEANASLAELMNRMDHSSTRAARVYLHAREERCCQLASTHDKTARRELETVQQTRNGDQSDATSTPGIPTRSLGGTDDHGL